MDTTLVSARMPRAKKERAGCILASMGITASDLINNAYDYVITTRQLPMVADEEKKRDQESFEAFVAASTVEVDWPVGDSGDYKALYHEWRRSDYESLT